MGGQGGSGCLRKVSQDGRPSPHHSSVCNREGDTVSVGPFYFGWGLTLTFTTSNILINLRIFLQEKFFFSNKKKLQKLKSLKKYLNKIHLFLGPSPSIFFIFNLIFVFIFILKQQEIKAKRLNEYGGWGSRFLIFLRTFGRLFGGDRSVG